MQAELNEGTLNRVEYTRHSIRQLMNPNTGAGENRYAAHRSSQFIITISPADKATDSNL
ncbi:unnamed protein product [Penicillium camemberti]|uniref:Str. FM013 n=1 Tax=Penicillium camemberti (strain FM 013) TaxID=1429867 RepID=A0A0G4PHF2_PENC3|nr:unnamed protein product [Penicillium camemberti]